MIVAPTRDKPLLEVEIRLLRVYADRSCKGWLPVNGGGRVDAQSFWLNEIEPMLVEGTFTNGLVADRLMALEALETQRQLDWIKDTLTREPTRGRRQRELMIVRDYTRSMEGEEARCFPLPIRADARAGISLRDRWNDKRLLVRTRDQDVLVVWSTSC